MLRLIVDEFSKLRRERVGDEELSDAKAYLAGHFPLTIETPDDIATQVLNALFYGLPLDELQTYRERVNAVDVDEVSARRVEIRAAGSAAVVLVGNASAFLDQLKGVGFGKYEVVRLSELDLSAVSFKRKDAVPGNPGSAGAVTSDHLPGARVHGPSAADRDAGAEPLAETQAPADPAQALIARAIEGKGGLAKLESVKTVEATSTTTLMMPQGAVKTDTTTYIEYPDGSGSRLASYRGR